VYLDVLMMDHRRPFESVIAGLCFSLFSFFERDLMKDFRYLAFFFSLTLLTWFFLVRDDGWKAISDVLQALDSVF
jgi:hypothetical protein